MRMPLRRYALSDLMIGTRSVVGELADSKQLPVSYQIVASGAATDAPRSHCQFTDAARQQEARQLPR
jgi:hypothetical protein